MCLLVIVLVYLLVPVAPAGPGPPLRVVFYYAVPLIYSTPKLLTAITTSVHLSSCASVILSGRLKNPQIDFLPTAAKARGTAPHNPPSV